jgi:alpha-1,2-glucosyltransferase
MYLRKHETKMCYTVIYIFHNLFLIIDLNDFFVLQFGAFSILFRQTNVIWMTFCAANGAISYVQDIYLKNNVSREKSESTCKSYKVVSHNDNQISSQGLRRRRINSPIAKNEVASESSELCNSEYSCSFVLDFINYKCKFLPCFYITCTPFVCHI